MRVWLVGNEDINQLYNNLNIVIKSGSVVELHDDTAVFLLNKKNIRGIGLVQLKDGDNREERYNEGRSNIYAWAREKWSDFERHCEERGLINTQPLKPHAEILKYKKTIEEYEQWVSSGSPIPEEIKNIDESKKVYVCPNCGKEFSQRVAYFGHMRSHQKEEVNVHQSRTSDTSQGKS